MRHYYDHKSFHLKKSTKISAIIIFDCGSLKRRRPDLNRRVLVLQTIALPLGYYAELLTYFILSNTSFYVKSFIGANL